ncbi:MAG: hypothetical protein ACXWXQ_11160 [Actinomycetota bacterium]
MFRTLGAKMSAVARRSTVSSLLVLALALAACGSDDGGDAEPSPASGSVTQDAVEGAVLGLCEVVAATDFDVANATFQDRSHQTLHAVAGAAEDVDRAAAGDLLSAKQRVEADLAGAGLPAGFSGDVEALLGATRAALAAIGLEAPACPA